MNVRTMSREELDTAVRWADDEGWNPGLFDGDAFYATDPQGFLVGLIDDKPVACISAVSYAGTFGFIGFYIVRPEFRGQGLGLQIWNSGMRHLDGHLIGLDGVVDQQTNYMRSGFQLAHRSIRFVAQANPPESAAIRCRRITHNDLPALCDYDLLGFPVIRGRFLEAWIAMPDTKTVVFEENRVLRGYGTVRPCRSGFKIGPLFADSFQVASEIYGELCRELKPGSEVFLDVPEPNLAAQNLIKLFNMQPRFEVARMYTGSAPNLDLGRVFGNTTFELG